MSAPKRFVGLHAHSGTGSPFDGLGFPDQHIDFVLKNGMNSWALTDHGNGNGLAHAHAYAQKLKKKGQQYRQLYGCEFYFVPSLEEWQKQIAAYKNGKKSSDTNGSDDILSEDEVLVVPSGNDEEEGGLVVEDEDESKSLVSQDEWKRRYHLVVFAKNKTGLKNLFTLIKRSYVEGMYKFPRIDFKMLREHGEGLVVSTACVGGYPTSLIFKGEAQGRSRQQILRSLKNMVGSFQEAVGEENFNVEIQWNSLDIQHKTNSYLIELARENSLNIVSTADSHYYSPDMWEARELYKKLGRMGNRGDSMPKLPAFDELKCELYPKNALQMWEEYLKHRNHIEYTAYDKEVLDSVVRASIERTYDIAWDQCEDVWFDEKAKLPSFSTAEKSAMAQLVELTKRGMIREGLQSKPEYIERAKMELEDIKHLGFENYFLTMTKVFDEASKETFIGPGRGSGAGSLVNYLLGITSTDPIKYGLLWERFLHRAKAGWPDIDTDAGDRDVLINCARRLFGEESVIPVSNFNTLKLKSLIKDVSKFYEIDFEEVNSMTSKLQDEVMNKAMGDHEEKSTYVLTHEDCLKYSEDYRIFMDKHPKVRDMIKSLFMESKSIGRHAGGVLICPNLEDHMPLIKVRGELQTPWSEGMNFRHLEPNGFLKFDFLGLTTLKMVEDCIRLILKNKTGKNPTFAEVSLFFQENIDCRKHDLNDPKVWKHVYHEGRFVQVFQFTQGGARAFCMDAKPNNIEELATITSIYRPGPLAANVHKKYVEQKKSVEKGNPIVWDHPKIEAILGPTFGFICFQEQFMLLAQELAGFDKGESDKMRKTLVKKSLDANDAKVKEREDLRYKFVKGCIELSGIPKDKAEKLFETIEYFSGYGFNKTCTFDTLLNIYDKDDNLFIKQIKDVSPGDRVPSRDEAKNKNMLLEVKERHCHGEMPVFTIELETGESVTCSMNHKFRTECGRMLPLWMILQEDLSIVSAGNTLDQKIPTHRIKQNVKKQKKS